MQCRHLVSLTTWFAIPAYEVSKPRRWRLQHPEPSKQYPALNTGKLPMIILEPGPPYNRISVLISICQTSVPGGDGGRIQKSMDTREENLSSTAYFVERDNSQFRQLSLDHVCLPHQTTVSQAPLCCDVKETGTETLEARGRCTLASLRNRPVRGVGSPPGTPNRWSTHFLPWA